MNTISDNYKSRSVHSVRINDKLVEIAKKTGLPLSQIIENCLTNFATLNDEEKINFMILNDPGKVNISDLVEPSFNYAEEAVTKAKQNLGTKQLEHTSTKVLIALGLTLILAYIFSKKEE